MFNYETDEAVSCFSEAQNLNAAIKKIFKTETTLDERTTRFAKAFRQAAKASKKDAIESFVNKALPDYEEHLFAVCRNAYSDQIDAILDSVIQNYAEAFNASYDHDGSGNISVQDDKAFESIGREALDAISSQIESAKEFPKSGFMKNTVAYSLFDRAVLEELKKRIGDSPLV